MKKYIIAIILLSTIKFAYAQQSLRVLVIFAHPDEGEIYAGGVAALYSKLGHEVKFMSLTNGDAGHYSMKPKDLAERRYKEAMKAKEILGLSAYEILDYHDGVLKNTEEIRRKVIKSIEAWNADIVFTFYPAKGGHNDNMNAGWIVREASEQLDQQRMPVFMYMRDFHTAAFSYIPDVAIDIDEVWETKLASCGAHESQVVEANPKAEGVLDEVLASKKKQAEFLFHNTIPFSIARPDNLIALQKWYGKEIAQNVTFVEEFEIAEFGRQPNDDEVYELFPMIGRTFTISGKANWFDTGIDLKDGQLIDISANGKILWNLNAKNFCNPDGATPYTQRENNPLPAIGTGALIGKIGKESSDYFFIGKRQEINAYKSGRLYLGINDDDTNDNGGMYRVRIKIK
ncbi:PIG-L deacetylase family protein [Maribacter sp. ACAM166]|uniref:PIG-L deacetylase family protein n=1 Tax=Maribacter sp. ACAM166 TaxID=2508996 RepID=UPI0010FEA321|nr:PIG-L family deacetylase [Maribacter sp. ACAM166]TLP79262.1 PIG-L family deacetylase [Maribacter sp. ACAM166]